MTASERRRRDTKIVADRARGMTWPELADRHSVSERTARRAVEARYRREPDELEPNPEAIVRETLAMLEQSIGDYALLSLTASGEAVRLGAMKARDDAARHRIEVMRSIGRLPRDWQDWLGGAETLDLLHRFLAVLERRGVDEQTLVELRAVVDRTAAPTLNLREAA